MSKYNPKEVEKKFQEKWEREQTYAYEDSSKKESFVIDTPPPTVSGSLHIGHIFSYTQTDILARFQRMQGKNIFYPMGWDDNGLPTERRTQNLYGVQCDPSLDYDPSFQPQKLEGKSKNYQSISRKNFLELCEKQVLEDEIKYKKLWSHIALSVDWGQTYRSIDSRSQTLAQLSFLDLYKKDLVENRLSPVLWDTQFQTAVAQAEVEDRKQRGFFHFIAFQVEGGGEFTIATTRPELLPACVAVAAHPDDKRFKKFFGKKAITPLFQREVPIYPSPHADPEKGTGILMICTYGDMEDVSFCHEHKLPVLQIIDDQAKLMDIDFFKKPFESLNPGEAFSYYSKLKGLRVKQARAKIVEILKENKILRKESEECEQNVKFYEKGDFPLEILPKRQWYVKILDHREELLKQGRKIKWHPSSMLKRYDQWVEGLNQDWCISRQRFYGVPFPLWYKVNEKGEKDYSQIITLKEFGKNPRAIDPLKDRPSGFKEEQRDKPGGFSAETDVMDTWATSSLTPYINSGWLLDSKKHKKLFPAGLRPQAHEIIRTWAFYTIVKAYFHEKQIPWKNIAISGWVVTPKGAKMSKSKGNALTPESLIEEYSADAVRYWTGKAGLGQDTAFDENLFKIGKKLSTKIFNAARFVQMQVEDMTFQGLKTCNKEITEPIDRLWLKKLLEVYSLALSEFQNYNYASSLNAIEKLFWLFCDNYLELVKARVYQLKDKKEGISGKRSLDYSLYTFLKLFAPYLPYVTEEVWQSRYKSESSSIHNSLWLKEKELETFGKQMSSSLKVPEEENFVENAFFLLEKIRSAKSDLNKSLASPLKSLKVTAHSNQLKQLEFFKEDIARAGHVSLENIFTNDNKSQDKAQVEIEL